MVGMPVTRYDDGVTGFSSTFIFRKVILSPWSAAISLRIGSTWRHGPHHSAQKSTRTGLSDLSTVVSKSASVTAGKFATGVPSSSSGVDHHRGRSGCHQVNIMPPTD